MYNAIPDAVAGIPLWVPLGLLGTLTLFAFWLITAASVQVLRDARPENRRGHIARRLRLVLLNTLGQPRRLDEPLTGAATLLILWAALLHVLAFVWDVVAVAGSEILSSVLPSEPLALIEEIAPLSWLLGAAAAAGLIGITTATAVRLAGRKNRPGRRHLVILGILAVIMTSSLAGAVLRPRGDTMASLCWSNQMLATGGLLAWIALRERHIVFSPVSIYSSLLAAPPVPPPSVGARYRDDFTWRELIGGLACADCRRCERVCPIFAATGSGSPRGLMQALSRSVSDGRNGRSRPADNLRTGQRWSCSTCGLCMQVCPSFNEPVPLVLELRRRFVAEANIPERLRMTMYDLMRFGNTFAAPAAERGRWTDGLDFPVPDAREKPVSCLWVVGDYASWGPGVTATRAAARVLHRAGIDFGILYDGERNSGNDIRRAGAEAVFHSLAERNRRAIAAARFEKIITTDPHTYNALRNDYDWEAGRPVILHISEVLAHVLRTGSLLLRRELRGAVTYQDPCYLGRHNGVFDAPRRVIAELGLDLLEMPRNRAQAACCGAGGGRLWSTRFAAGMPNPAELRVREAAGVSGVQTLVTACPKDLSLLRYATRSAGLAQRLAVRDLAELVDEATSSAPPSGRQTNREQAAV